MRPPTLELREVSHRWPEGALGLDRVSLAVAPGEALALTGPTGSGKSTLLRHLNGLLRPTAGLVLVGGRDAAELRVAQLARLVGVAFQEPDRQLFCVRVREELAFGAPDRRAVAEALDLLGLEGLAEANPQDLGYSRRKLVAIAAVLAMRTPVVVLDEPTTGQDRAGLERLERLMGRLRVEGRSAVVVSHRPDFVHRTCDRELRLREGRLSAA